MKLHLNPLLIRSELLFLKFKRMLDIIDRDTSLNSLRHDDPYNNGNTTTTGSSENSNNGEIIGDELRELLRKDLVIQKEVERPEGVGGG